MFPNVLGLFFFNWIFTFFPNYLDFARVRQPLLIHTDISIRHRGDYISGFLFGFGVIFTIFEFSSKGHSEKLSFKRLSFNFTYVKWVQ